MTLTDVAASSTRSVWAVGYYTDRYGRHKATILRHEATGWHFAGAANPGLPAATGNELSSVVAISDRNAWAFGHTKTGSVTRPLAEHWNGQSWRVVAMSVPGGGWITSACQVVGHPVIWAVGGRQAAADRSLVMRWGGSHWRVVHDAAVKPLVTCVAAPNIAWASGGSFERWNGTAWIDMPVPVDQSGETGGLFQTISGISPTNLDTLVGANQYMSLWSHDPLAGDWVGAGFYNTTINSPLRADLAPAPLGMWLVVSGRAQSTEENGSYIERWTGNEWKLQRLVYVLSGVGPHLAAITRVPNTGAVWAVGYGGAGPIALTGP